MNEIRMPDWLWTLLVGAVVTVTGWLVSIERRFGRGGDRFGRIETRLDNFDRRMDRYEKNQEKHGDKLDAIHAAVIEVRTACKATKCTLT